MKRLLAIAGASVCFAGFGIHAQTADRAESLSARTNYLERCGGCHGITGKSASALVPDLKDRAGYFLCSPQSRSYAARLPNVVFAEIRDNDLAALLNYVVFDLGAGSVPAGAAKYTQEELSAFRKDPLTTTDLVTYRRTVLTRLVKDCGAPPSLLTDYHPSMPTP